MTNRITTRTGLELTTAGGDPGHEHLRLHPGHHARPAATQHPQPARLHPVHGPSPRPSSTSSSPTALNTTSIDDVRTGIQALPDSTLKSSLLAVLKSAGTDIDTFRTAVEHWYDDHMSRVSGWYKRRVAKITLVVGALLVILLNINALTIAKTLYTDNDVRSTIAAVAGKSRDLPRRREPADLPEHPERAARRRHLRRASRWAGAPSRTAPTRTTPCNWWDQRGLTDPHGGSAGRLVFVLLGFALTITALVPGARFWFDLLSRLGSLRTSGPKPATSN